MSGATVRPLTRTGHPRLDKAIWDLADDDEAVGTVDRYELALDGMLPRCPSRAGQGAEFLVVTLGPDLWLGLAICFEHAFPQIFASSPSPAQNVIAIRSAVSEGSPTGSSCGPAPGRRTTRSSSQRRTSAATTAGPADAAGASSSAPAARSWRRPAPVARPRSSPSSTSG